MPKNFVEAGKAALDKVKQQIPDLGSLARLIRAKDPSANIQSCMATASVLGDVISDNPVVQFPGFSGKTVDKKIALIEDALKQPRALYINVSPDHHFWVITIDKDKLSLLQGFQGVYSLIDWMKHRGTGVIRKDEFIATLREFVSKDEANKQAAAINLFSYALAYEGKAASGKAKTVEDGIHAWFDTKTTYIQQSLYKEL